jgi:hypothetical protein
MTTDALNILGKLIGSKSRENRLTELLRSPYDEDENTGWFMHVPICFNNALDIQSTTRVGTARPVWTQGGNFDFHVGDSIYDTRLAYAMPWGQALHNIRYCFSVTQATPAQAATKSSLRNAGSVTFDVLAPNDERTALRYLHTLTMTQDRFVQILIEGASDIV